MNNDSRPLRTSLRRTRGGEGLEPQRAQTKLRDLRALRGDQLFDYEGRDVHEGRDTN